MNKRIIIVGAFHEIIELCEDCGFQIVGIIDNKLQNNFMGYPIIGTDADVSKLYKTYAYCEIVISPDSSGLRSKLSDLYSQAGFDFATVISPRATISRSATIGKGTVVQSGVNVSAGTIIGKFVKLNTGANVMHDNHIGDFVTIAPNAVVLGYVNVGSSCYIGANSTILPRITIGPTAIVGAGAVVTKSVASQTIVKGVPAK
jgi:sugar O-acyltransferase (sialic acid O-acetyltransferase NeuD family)